MIESDCSSLRDFRDQKLCTQQSLLLGIELYPKNCLKRKIGIIENSDMID